MTRENRRLRNQRAADYQRALAALRRRHPDEFAELYAHERNHQTAATPAHDDDHASR